MYSNNKLSKAVRLAIAFGAASAVTGTAVAQQAQSDEASSARVERIEVTGSRIKRADMETASPISVIGRADIEASGLTSVGDLLRNINQADLSGLTQLTNATNGNDGTSTISFRNLGSARTLVLVDGRRWLALGGGQVDLSEIPVAVIERIEILADGASAVYGSDAISGVVNIITRKDVDGITLDLGYGENFKGDGEKTTASLSTGVRSAKTGVFLNITKQEDKPIMAGDRSISEFPQLYIPNALGSSFSEYGRFTVPGLGSLSLRPEREGAAGPRTPADFEPTAAKHNFNFAPENYLFMPASRLSIFAKADHELNDNVRAFLQTTYNQRKSDTQIASVPITAGFSGPQWIIPISANNIYNPFGAQINSWGFRTTPLGPRTNFQDYDTYFVTAGLEGDFELADRGFTWEVYGSRGDSSRTSTGTNYVNLFNLKNAVGPSFINEAGIPTCGTPTNPLPSYLGCVPLNPFNGITGVTPAMANYINANIVQQVKTGVKELAVNVTGDLFELPAGMVAFAAGAQQRTNTYVDAPDSLIAAGGHSNNFREATNGSQEAKEYYFEFAIPVLRDLPGVQSFDLNIAGRSSDFTNTGLVGTAETTSKFDNDSFKYGFTWRVFEDLMLRGNYSDTFRAPAVNNLFQGGGEGFPPAQDPCNTANFPGLNAAQQARCAAQGVPAGGSLQPTSQLRQLTGGNPFLQPESGKTRTLGIVYNPSFLDGFDMTLDWYRIDLQDALSSLGAQTMLNRCIRNGEEQFCGFIERGGDGGIVAVRATQFNLSKLQTSGVDATFNYQLNTEDLGRFTFRLAGTYVNKYRSAGENASLKGARNQVGATDSDVLRKRGSFSTTWNYEDWTVTWAMRYTSSFMESCWATPAYIAANATQDICNQRDKADEDNPLGYNRIGSVVYHDVSASYALPWNASVRVGTRNLFRKDPPPSIQEFANSFRQIYDIPGGTWFVNYSQNF